MAPKPKADNAADNTAPETEKPYEPQGEVRELASAKRNGKTVRVVSDDVRVWKEEGSK